MFKPISTQKHLLKTIYPLQRKREYKTRQQSMASRIKPKGFALSEFVVDGKTVRARYKNDLSDWITIAYCRTAKQAQVLRDQLDELLQRIENHIK